MVNTRGATISVDGLMVDARELVFPVRATAPLTGKGLPVILFSHGAECRRSEYQALVTLWAQRGFLVIQPSHPDQFSFLDNPRLLRIWHDRVMQMSGLLDTAEALFEQTPALAGRADWNRVAGVGHSYGGHTIANLLGARSFDQETGAAADLGDPRIRAGVLLAAPGCIALDSVMGKAHPHLHIDFSTMAAALVVAGGLDDSAHVGRSWEWHSDPFTQGPSPKSLMILPEAAHYLHGILGRYSNKPEADYSDEMIEVLAEAVVGYLLARLGIDDAAWTNSLAGLAEAGAIIREK